MSSGIQNETEPTLFTGNVAIHPSTDPSEGNGSVEIAGALFCDELRSYHDNTAIAVFDTQFTPNNVSCTNISAQSLTLLNPLPISCGGIGVISVPAGRILIGNGTSPILTSPNLLFNQETSSLMVQNQQITGNLSVSGDLILQKPLPLFCGGLGLSTLSVGSIPFGDSSTAVTSSSQFNYDKVANKLYVENISVGSNATINGVATIDEINSGKISVSTSANFSCPVVIEEAIAQNHAATKGYVDAVSPGTIIAGDGLTRMNSTLNVNNNQPQITSLGVLTSLAVTGSLSSGALSSTTGAFSGITNVANTTKLAATTNTISASSGSLTLAGDLHLYHTSAPQIAFFAGSQAPPAFTTRSAGTRVVVYPSISTTAVDYAIGCETSNMWFSTPTSTSGFKWYGGTSLAAALTGAGALTLTSGLAATNGTFSGAITGTVFSGSSASFSGNTTAASFLTGTGSISGSGAGLSVRGGSTTANFISFKPNTVALSAPELLITSASTVLKRNDGTTNSLSIDNATGIITIGYALNLSGSATLQGVTSAELTQIGNINSVAISNAKWTYLGAMNLNVHSTSSPTFVAVTLGSLTATTGTFSGNVTAPSFSGNLIGGTLSATTGTYTGQISTGGGNVFKTAASVTDYSMLGTNPTDGPQNTRIVVNGNTRPSYSGMIEYQATNTGNHVFYNAGTVSLTVTNTGVITNLITATTGSFSGDVSATTGNFSGSCVIPTPTLAAHATTKAYVDGLTFLIPGTGLTLASGSLSVNASQPQITAVGTLTSLAVTGGLSSGALSSTTGTFSGITNVVNTTKLADT